jgi:hypothetical protein
MSQPQKPVLAKQPIQQSPKPVAPARTFTADRWMFSFRFFKQIENFGLDKQDANWFVSVIEKLVDLSNETVDVFFADKIKKNYWRYHDISWTKKNVPIRREDLKWLQKDYLENATEFPIVQFQISKALGRVVGFWDENRVFNIILLDPLHNIQPSRDFSYKVDPCSPLPCKYTTLLDDIEAAKKNNCPTETACPVNAALRTIPKEGHTYQVTILRLRDDLAKLANEVIEAGKAKSIEEIIENGVLSLSESTPS